MMERCSNDCVKVTQKAPKGSDFGQQMGNRISVSNEFTQKLSLCILQIDLMEQKFYRTILKSNNGVIICLIKWMPDMNEISRIFFTVGILSLVGCDKNALNDVF